jgi:hypothetical protein
MCEGRAESTKPILAGSLSAEERGKDRDKASQGRKRTRKYVRTQEAQQRRMRASALDY